MIQITICDDIKHFYVLEDWINLSSIILKKLNNMNNDSITIEAEGQHNAWNNELNANLETLSTFENQLSQITSPTNKTKIEHFQNQFLIQKSNIGDLKNEIQKHDIVIAREGKDAFEEMKQEEMNYHKMISDKFDIQINIINDLKKEFQEFLISEK